MQEELSYLSLTGEHPESAVEGYGTIENIRNEFSHRKESGHHRTETFPHSGQRTY